MKKEKVVVFPTEILTAHVPTVGLMPAEPVNADVLLDQCFAIDRAEAEERMDVVQLVSSFLVTCKGEILIHERTSRGNERRLRGEETLFFGGHLTPADLSPLFSIFDPASAAGLLERELSEELDLEVRPSFHYMGVVYDDSREVSRQHLGLLYRAETSTFDFRLREPSRMRNARYETVHTVRANADRLENWSRIILDTL